MICSLDLSQSTTKFSTRKFVLWGSSNGPVYTWRQVPQTTFVGRRWGREHGRIGEGVRVLYRKREAGEITQRLTFRNGERAKGGSRECMAPGYGEHE